MGTDSRYQSVEARTCDACHNPLPSDAGEKQRFHEPCRKIRYLAAALRREVEAHPELRDLAARELAAAGMKPRRVAGDGDRPAWRDRRRDVYLPGSLWVLVQCVAKKGAETPVTYSAALRWIIKSWWKEFAGRRLRVVDGEVVGWAEEEREVA